MIHNFQTIEFHTFFEDEVQNNILDSLLTYDLLKNDVLALRKQETKRLISYFIIYHVTKTLQESKVDKTVFVIQPFVLNRNTDFFNYVDTEELANSLCKYVMTILKMLAKSHPDQVLIFKKEVNVKSIDTLHVIFSRCNTFSSGSTRSIKSYSKENFNNSPPGKVSNCY